MSARADIDARDRVRHRVVDPLSVIRHVRSTNLVSRVTVGVPTYNRAHTLGRALGSLARQTFRDFTVIVSDNAGANQATLDVVREIESDLPEIRLVAQPDNIGILGNLEFLLDAAETEYFMWLADDDEITPNYLAELVGLLDKSPDRVAAMGAWRKMTSEIEANEPAQLQSIQVSRLLRGVRYVVSIKDDTLLYGLHRTASLRRCSFDTFAFPNRGVITNLGYTFLFDLILQGPIAYSAGAALISHIYTVKAYSVARAHGVKDRLRTLARRANVYYLYCKKTARKYPLMLLAILPAALFAFARDLLLAVFRVGMRGIIRRETA